MDNHTSAMQRVVASARKMKALAAREPAVAELIAERDRLLAENAALQARVDELEAAVADENSPDSEGVDAHRGGGEDVKSEKPKSGRGKK